MAFVILLINRLVSLKITTLSWIKSYISQLVLWKCLYTETSQCRNATKTGFQEFPFFWGEIPQNWKMLRDFQIFLRRFQIFKVVVFPFFLRHFRFLRRFCFLKKVFKFYFVEAFPLYFEAFPFF